MIDVQGIWKASYSAVTNPKGGYEETESATVELKNGQISGFDPHGGVYSGTYRQENENLSISIHVDRSSPEDETVFKDLEYPLNITLEGTVAGADFIMLKGLANGTHELNVQCKRLSD